MLTKGNVQKKLTSKQTQPESKIALMAWGHVWEDFYDSIGISWETFLSEYKGSWMFNYIDALQLAGVQTVVFYPSTRVTEPSRFIHKPTGATICMLPAPKSYRAIRRQMVEPYPSFGGGVGKVFGDVRGSRRILSKIFYHLAPYLATPIGLLARELRREGCSAILCQEYEYFRFDVCVILGRLMGLPVFATFQGTNSDGNYIAHFLRPLSMGACASLIIGTQTEIERVSNCHNLPPAKIARIFNPVDLSMWSASDRGEARAMVGLPAEAQVVVWHGRVEIQTKGLDILLDAWEQVCRERTGQNLWLLLIGTGTDAEILRQRIAAMQMQNVLWVDKFVNDRTVIQGYLSAGDVYAFPSRHEGFPVAPIEAMACELPVVAAAAPGVPDIFEGGEASGGLVVPCNDAAAFALALGSILDDQAWGRELGKRARCRVEEYFSLEVVGRQLRDLLLKKEMPTFPDA